jgi:uncharacterized membrane protein
MDIALLVALFVHTVGFVIGWGYYGVMGRIVLPGLNASLELPAAARSAAAIDRRALPLVAISAVLFLVSGTYLLLADPEYAGLGNVSASSWTVLMLLKHLVVVLLVVAAVAFTFLVRGLSDDYDIDDATRRSTLRRARWAAEAATAFGAVIALLTVAAQLSA